MITIASSHAGARRVASAAAVAAAAAGVAFGLHHLSPADPHHIEGVAVLLLGVVVLVVGPVALIVARRHPDPPAVIVPGSDGVTVRDLRGDADTRVAAALHAALLPHGFFVALGPQFLREYERGFTDAPHATALVAEIDGHVVGMLVGVLEPAKHSRWLLQRRGATLAALGACSLAVRPLVAVAFLRRRAVRYARGWRRRRGQAVACEPEHGGQTAILSHVAVAPGAQGTGAGTRLLEAFEARARARGCSAIQLMTLPDSQGAGGFYTRLGWTHCGRTTTVDGNVFDLYRKELRC